MIKAVSHRSLWLLGLILVIIAALFISGGCGTNQPPVISNLAIITEGEVNPGGSTYIECTATDPDSKDLSYTWSADGGTISGSGTDIKWTAPNQVGTYTVTVEVSDGKNVATDQLAIKVLPPNTPPTITNLTTNCPRVKPSKTGTITCEASDPDGDKLTYTWSADRGSFTGEGATVTWVAPGDYGTYVISVIVSDGRGGEATSNIHITVCSCGTACG
jgi:hypothetical protein